MKLQLLPILLISLALLGCTQKPETVERIPKPVVLTISPETTYLTEPLLPDGRIDYLTAFNEKMSAQTTPENNLLVGVFSLVIGETEEAILSGLETAEEKRQYRERFWKMLGRDAPPLDSLVATAPIASSRSFEGDDTSFREGLLEFHSEEELAPIIERERENEKQRLKTRLEGSVIICCGREFVIDPDGITREEYEAELKRIETETPDILPVHY